MGTASHLSCSNMLSNWLRLTSGTHRSLSGRHGRLRESLVGPRQGRAGRRGAHASVQRLSPTLQLLLPLRLRPPPRHLLCKHRQAREGAPHPREESPLLPQLASRRSAKPRLRARMMIRMKIHTITCRVLPTGIPTALPQTSPSPLSLCASQWRLHLQSALDGCRWASPWSRRTAHLCWCMCQALVYCNCPTAGKSDCASRMTCTMLLCTHLRVRTKRQNLCVLSVNLCHHLQTLMLCSMRTLPCANGISPTSRPHTRRGDIRVALKLTRSSPPTPISSRRTLNIGLLPGSTAARCVCS
mmetsp:Transcript_60736/g.125106  ORF Transcript_60736/g.125106 Transcript_60736/m.125106 type:complete len:299 (-) Transcript_60736:1257-2153(-)